MIFKTAKHFHHAEDMKELDLTLAWCALCPSLLQLFPQSSDRAFAGIAVEKNQKMRLGLLYFCEFSILRAVT